VLGDNDQFTCQRCSLLRRRKALQTFVVGESLEIGGRIYGLSTRTQAVAPVVKAYDLLYPLDANVKRAVAFGEGLGIVPATRAERLAVGVKDRRDFGLGNAHRFSVTIGNAATQPGAVIGNRDEVTAVRLDMDSRDATEGRIFRGKSEPRNFKLPKRVCEGSRLSNEEISVASISIRVGTLG
jgi:hypothetical protein